VLIGWKYGRQNSCSGKRCGLGDPSAGLHRRISPAQPGTPQQDWEVDDVEH